MYISNFMKKRKDGGPRSPVDAYFLIEIKGLFTIALLKFNKGGRESYHTHAFNALTWFLSGALVEQNFEGPLYTYKKSLIPKLTRKSKNHRVLATKDSWCLTIRGRWDSTWTEHDTTGQIITTFTDKRKIVSTTNRI